MGAEELEYLLRRKGDLESWQFASRTVEVMAAMCSFFALLWIMLDGIDGYVAILIAVFGVNLWLLLLGLYFKVRLSWVNRQISEIKG